MSWNRHGRGTRRYRELVPVLALLVLLGGCATGPTSSTSTEAEAEARAREARERMQQNFGRALTLTRDGELEQARTLFLELRGAHPHLAAPVFNLGVIAREQGRTEAAGAHFRDLLQRHPGHPRALNELGVMAREQGAFDEAEDYYRRALAADPEFLPALRNLAVLLELYRGRLQEALALYQRYQSLLATPEPGLDDWIFDLRNRQQRESQQ